MKTDRLIVQMVVTFIGAACLLSIGGLIGLSFLGRPVPESLTTLGAAAIGALGSMLSRTSTEAAPPTDSSSAICSLPEENPLATPKNVVATPRDPSVISVEGD